MNFVLVHIGTPLPGYVADCVDQIKFTTPTAKVFLLTDSYIKSQYEWLHVVDIGQFKVPDISNYFYWDQHHISLWQTSLKRLFYIEAFLDAYDIEECFHFDCDVLLFQDLENKKHIFQSFEFLITPHFSEEYVFGFSYIKKSDKLRSINEQLYILASLDRNKIVSQVGWDFPHEMRLLSYINKLSDYSLIDRLPVVVEGDGSTNFNLFQTIFDPSTYGKYLGGSHCFGQHNQHYVSTESGYGTELHHYAGKQIYSKRIEVRFADNKPILTYSGVDYYIANLHIHSKNLKRFKLC